MAERRMFTKRITESDAFLEMPSSAQNLYFHLNMEADDDGFVNAPKKIMNIVGASEDDMRLLIMRKFILVFESGVIVIKHWRMHNLLRHDRYHPTQYQDEFKMLSLDEENKYHLGITGNNEEQPEIPWQPNGNQMATEVRLGKDRLGKDSVFINAPGAETCGTKGGQCPKKKKPFKEPTLDEVKEYCIANGYEEVDAEKFISYYSKNNWTVKGKNGERRKMKNWKICLNSWVVNEIRFNKTNDLRNRAREAYIRDVELKEKREETKGGFFFDINGDLPSLE